MSTKVLQNKKTLSLKAKTIATLVSVVCAVVIPQIFHILGAASGLGTSLGEIFLPMHLPVILVGLFAGPCAGAVSGALSPLASFALTGMPFVANLPFMMLELCAYGLFAGLVSGVKMPSVAKVVVAQLAGRVVRLAALAVAFYLFDATKIAPMSVVYSVKTGLFGLALQWTMIPLTLFYVESLTKHE